MKLSARMLCLVLLQSCSSNPVYNVPKDAYTPGRVQDTGKNVILITVDGVRWQEFFHGTDPELNLGRSRKVGFPRLTERLSRSGLVLGDRTAGSDMTVSNLTLNSLPAYQSLLTGLTQNCFSNNCARIQVPSVQERLLEGLKLQKDQVATFASWDKIGIAAEHELGKTTVSAGIARLQSPKQDSELSAINEMQFHDESSGEVRTDEDTMEMAHWYLKNHEPRFLYVSLNDSDHYAHDGKYTSYMNQLEKYDEFLELVFKTLESKGEYGKSTLVLVTTDHGRGNGKSWTDHGSGKPEAKFIWLAAVGAGMTGKLTSSETYEHKDIVPTILHYMGVEAKSCPECGRPIAELLK